MQFNQEHKLEQKLFKDNASVLALIKKHNEFIDLMQKNKINTDDLSKINVFYTTNKDLINQCITLQKELKKVESAQVLNKRRSRYWNNFDKTGRAIPRGLLMDARVFVALGVLSGLVLLAVAFLISPVGIPFAATIPLIVMAAFGAVFGGISLLAAGFQQKNAQKKFESLFKSYPENKDAEPSMAFFEQKKAQLNEDIKKLTAHDQDLGNYMLSNTDNDSNPKSKGLSFFQKVEKKEPSSNENTSSPSYTQ